jgi:hypothetical protein
VLGKLDHLNLLVQHGELGVTHVHLHSGEAFVAALETFSESVLEASGKHIK